MISKFKIILWSLLSLIPGIFGQQANNNVSKPNILIIQVDDFGYVNLNLYGNQTD